MNLNKAIIIGRVTGDIELRTIPNGTNVASFSVATNRVFKDAAGNKKETTEFHNVVLWRRIAEIAHQYLSKGQLVFIEGHLQTRSWEGKDGVTRYRTEIVGENMQLGPRPGQPAQSQKKSDEGTPPPPDDISNNNNDTPQDNPAPSSNSTPNNKSNEEDIKVEDIPF
jgi:single-strand DNA-binding protein